MTGRIQRRKSTLPKDKSFPIKGSDLAKTGQGQRQIEDDDRTNIHQKRQSLSSAFYCIIQIFLT